MCRDRACPTGRGPDGRRSRSAQRRVGKTRGREEITGAWAQEEIAPRRRWSGQPAAEPSQPPPLVVGLALADAQRAGDRRPARRVLRSRLDRKRRRRTDRSRRPPPERRRSLWEAALPARRAQSARGVLFTSVCDETRLLRVVFEPDSSITRSAGTPARTSHTFMMLLSEVACRCVALPAARCDDWAAHRGRVCRSVWLHSVEIVCRFVLRRHARRRRNCSAIRRRGRRAPRRRHPRASPAASRERGTGWRAGAQRQEPPPASS